MRAWMLGVALGFGALAFAGCDVDVQTDRETAEDLEQADRDFERAGQELDEAAREAGQEVGRGLEKAGEELEETFGGSGNAGEWDERPDTPAQRR